MQRAEKEKIGGENEAKEDVTVSLEGQDAAQIGAEPIKADKSGLRRMLTEEVKDLIEEELRKRELALEGNRHISRHGVKAWRVLKRNEVLHARERRRPVCELEKIEKTTQGRMAQAA